MCIISSNNRVCTVICVVQAVRVNSDPIAIEDGLKQQHQQKRKRDKRQDEMSKPGGQSSCEKVLALRHAHFFTHFSLAQSWRIL